MRWRQSVACVLVGLAGCATRKSGLADDPTTLRPPGDVAFERGVPVRGDADRATIASAESGAEANPRALADRAATPAPALADKAVRQADATDPVPQLAEPPIAVSDEVTSHTPGLVEPPPDAAPTIEAQAQPEAPHDDAVTQTALAAGEERAAFKASPGKPASRIAARVGDTYISQRELTRALAERVSGTEGWAKLPPEQRKEVAREVLEYLINRAMVVQEARRQLNKPKQWDTLKEFVDKQWHESELPRHLKRFNVQSEAELAQKLSESGESLQDIKDAYQLEQIYRMYTAEKVRSKVAPPGLPEVYAFYRENIQKYQQTAATTWRELFFSVDEAHTRETAQAEAVDAAARLARGDDFVRLARETSRGPKAAEGGLWTLSPGAFKSDVVNKALDSLEIGQTSGVLDDPKGFYIVRVESRRPAGPVPFEQIQANIADELLQRQYEHAVEAFLADVRKRTVIESPLLEQTEAR